MFSMADADQLHFRDSCKDDPVGIRRQLLEFLNERADIKAVIIDTLQKVRKIGDDKTMYGSDYEVISRVKEIADRFHICVLFVHHTRKKKAADVFEEISGSQGLMGRRWCICHEKEEKNFESGKMLKAYEWGLQKSKMVDKLTEQRECLLKEKAKGFRVYEKKVAEVVGDA